MMVSVILEEIGAGSILGQVVVVVGRQNFRAKRDKSLERDSRKKQTQPLIRSPFKKNI